jgi:hypothetical protein
MLYPRLSVNLETPRWKSGRLPWIFEAQAYVSHHVTLSSISTFQSAFTSLFPVALFICCIRHKV